MGKGTTTGQGTGKQRAFGRSLGDFANLSDAEKEVVAATREGRVAYLGDKIPETKEENKERTIRADLVRFLALGGDDATPVHEQGVQVRGAIIDGALDFEGCTIDRDFFLWDCKLNGAVTLRGARTRSVNFAGCHCQKISADRVEVAGSLDFRNVFVTPGEIRLLGALIEGDLNCLGGRFEGRDGDGDALACDNLHIRGNAILRNAIITRGAVRLAGAEIGGNLECDRATLEGSDKDGIAFNCDRIQVGGSVFLRDGFIAQGAVNFITAKIGADANCNGGTFGTAGRAASDTSASLTQETPVNQSRASGSVIFARATVKGTLWLVGPSKAKFHVGLDLTGARIDRIVDTVSVRSKRRSPDSSPSGAREHPAFLLLDGLIYDRFGEGTDLSAAARIAFLRLQRENDLGGAFKPQPWMHMVKVLRYTGHADAAREVAIAYEEERRRAGVIGSKSARFLHRLYGLLVGYGHRPMRLFQITFCFWLFFGAVYFTAAELGVMAPTNPRVFDEPRHESCRPENGGNWTTCVKAPYEYTTFNPWIYSLDLMLPFVDLQQDRDWAPMMTRPCAVTKSIWVTDICWQSAAVAKAKGESFVAKPAYWISGTIVAAIMWFEILFGWAASLLLAAVLSGLAKRME